MDPNTGMIRNIAQYLESETPVQHHFDHGKTCPICLDLLSAATPPSPVATDALNTRYDRTFLCCSAGHSFHSHCLIGEIFTHRGGRPIQDRCPQCRRRLFADVERIANRYVHYRDRWERSGRRVRSASWRFLDGLVQLAGQQQFNLLHQSDYERGQTAWWDVRVAMADGDIDLFTAAMERAEEVDREIRRREMRR